MINELSPESINRFPDYVNKWTKIGYDCKPIDKAEATAAIHNLYKCGGFEPPERIIFTDGPIVATLLVNMLIYIEGNKNYTKQQLIDVFSSGGCEFQDCCYGQHEAGWLSYYDFYRNETDLPNLEKVEGLNDAAKTCGWIWAYEKVCVVSSKPLVCHTNDTNQLHCEDGPAIAYGDGTKVYSYEGVVVPEYVIMNPEKITLEDIASTDNEEQKRIKIHLYGTSKFLTDTGAEIVDIDMIKINPFDAETDSIPRALIKDKNDKYYLVGTDGSTHRTYYMNVPKVNTCAEAHNSIAPLNESLCIASS